MLKVPARLLKVADKSIINDGLQNPFNRLLDNINNAIPETTDSVHRVTERVRDSTSNEIR